MDHQSETKTTDFDNEFEICVVLLFVDEKGAKHA